MSIKENGNGTVSVRIWDKDGNYEWVTVTKELPYQGSENFGATGAGDTWPAYYEKAFALRYNEDDEGKRGYGGIVSDNQKHATPYITGKEGDDPEDGGFLGIGKDGERDMLGDSYTTGHVYYVRGFTNDGKIILGNPWGWISTTRKTHTPLRCRSE